MTIHELATQAGVTTRTIRYYVDEGLLPPPDRGRPAEYTGEHLRRLDLIRRLKEQYLPLEEIRETLQRLTLEQVDDLVAQHAATQQQQAKAAPADSAVDYITGVLQRTATRQHLKRQGPPAPYPAPLPPIPVPSAPGPAPGPLPGAPPPGTPYLPGTPGPIPTTPLPGAPAPAPAPPPEWQPSWPMQPSAPATAAPIVPAPPQIVTAPGTDAYTSQAGAWQRVHLAPGIELHYQVTNDTRFNRLVARLTEAARHLVQRLAQQAEEESR